ncbi:MAG: N-acetyltransferase [Deltaproteobacteria bacterium]|nr:N-acetyltransferase [Deltaproteobacteria bacterium]
MQLTIDEATNTDEEFLWLMLTYAASMGAGGIEQVPLAKRDPYLRCYVAGWGTKAGDLGVVARDRAGDALGAAWLRLGEEGGAFKLSSNKVPELATAVVPHARGGGVGTQLMTALFDLARPHYSHIVLSVRAGNPATRFYERLGFRETKRIENRVGGESLVMSFDL